MDMFLIQKSFEFSTSKVENNTEIQNTDLKDFFNQFTNTYAIQHKNETIGFLFYNNTAKYKIVVINDFFKGFSFDNYVYQMVR